MISGSGNFILHFPTSTDGFKTSPFFTPVTSSYTLPCKYLTHVKIWLDSKKILWNHPRQYRFFLLKPKFLWIPKSMKKASINKNWLEIQSSSINHGGRNLNDKALIVFVSYFTYYHVSVVAFVRNQWIISYRVEHDSTKWWMCGCRTGYSCNDIFIFIYVTWATCRILL